MDSAAPASRGRLFLAVGAAYAASLAVGLATAWLSRGHSPLLAGAAADVAATAAVFGFSVAFDNSSLYDPYWSVAPIPLVLFWCWSAGAPPDGRQALVVLLIVVWGVRLTFNCLERWRTLAQEDFRYVDIRHKTGSFYWPASFVSLHLMPTAWVFGGLLPLYLVLTQPGRPLTAVDVIAAIVTVAAIAIESVADRQLRAFLRGPRAPGRILDTGLWGLSRHPNYFGELLFWWGLYLFGIAALPRWPYVFLGPLALTVLFVFISVPLMDKRMASRHPGWAKRTKKLPALIPWPRTRPSPHG